MEIYGMTGERLGTIGSSDENQKGDLPQWKRDFLSKPSVSVRKGIAWGYQAPYEDTDTLVLTAPSGKFVDIRFPSGTDQNSLLSSHQAFWAFTGTSETTFLESDGGVSMPYSAHCVWKHEIDSRGPEITDEGDMFLLPSGDCMEVGSMKNPKTGMEEMYKEYWTEPPPLPAGDGAQKLPCFVVETVPNSSYPQRGRIIRVGNLCQAIVEADDRRGETVHVSRWIRKIEDEISTWIADVRSNPWAFPTSWIWEDGRKVGDETAHKAGQRWRVMEAVT